MINQFSPKVSEVLSFSREEAERLASMSVGPEHLLLAILREKTGPISNMFSRLHLNLENLKNQLEEKVKNENNGKMLISTDMLLNEKANNILKLAVLEARSQHTQTVDTQHLLLAILRDNVNNGAKEVLENNDLDYKTALTHLQQKANQAQDGIDMAGEEEEEDPELNSNVNMNSARTAQAPKTKSKTPILDNFGTDLTLAATEGKLDPVVGREKEILRISEILGRRKKNNPILIGEPGLAKAQ